MSREKYHVTGPEDAWGVLAHSRQSPMGPMGDPVTFMGKLSWNLRIITLIMLKPRNIAGVCNISIRAGGGP